jgi:hypothetical protein
VAVRRGQHAQFGGLHRQVTDRLTKVAGPHQPSDLTMLAAILIYLAKKSGRLIPAAGAGEAQVVRWCFAAMNFGRDAAARLEHETNPCMRQHRCCGHFVCRNAHHDRSRP